MKSFRIDDGYLLRLDRDEEVVSSVIKFVEESGLNSAMVAGIGAVTGCTLGYFDRDKKTYLSKNFDDVYELVSLQGNITFHEGKPVFHNHAAIADSEYNLYGGHLFSALIAVTGEIFIFDVKKKFNRALDSRFGLNLIDSEDNA
jgi:predicted DNA-binding protein with PD1-like motif